MSRTNTYQHFCPAARALEVVGEKWSLLIVRDLLAGPRRFTDLLHSNAAITPKWLTARLRDLEAAGIVERSTEPGRREVWYSLTPAGHELAPVLGALNAWGLRHAVRAPLPGELISPARIMVSFRGYLITKRVKLPSPATWRLSFGAGEVYTLRFDGRHWHEASGDETRHPPDVTIHTSPEAWANLFVRDSRPFEDRLAALSLEGESEALEAFAAVLRSIIQAPAAAV